jgi:hypothetical protein
MCIPPLPPSAFMACCGTALASCCMCELLFYLLSVYSFDLTAARDEPISSIVTHATIDTETFLWLRDSLSTRSN